MERREMKGWEVKLRKRSRPWKRRSLTTMASDGDELPVRTNGKPGEGFRKPRCKKIKETGAVDESSDRDSDCE